MTIIVNVFVRIHFLVSFVNTKYPTLNVIMENEIEILLNVFARNSHLEIIVNLRMTAIFYA